jgi:hypothetical protein
MMVTLFGVGYPGWTLSCIYKWKHQTCFVMEHPKNSGWMVEVDDHAVEQYVLRYFATWTAPASSEEPSPAMAHRSHTGTVDLRGSAILIANKILKAWHGNEFKIKLKDTYDCELRSCVIDMTKWLDPLTSDNLQSNDCVIDLEPLRRQLTQGLDVDPRTDEPKEHFLPSSIYVRREMKGIFKLFCRDVDLLHNNEKESVSSKKSSIVLPRKMATVFMGSSGVGKSILFFLAALYRSQSSVTIFIRQSPMISEYMSVFIMFPKPDEAGKVQVLFTRCLDDLQVHAMNGLSGLTLFWNETCC